MMNMPANGTTSNQYKLLTHLYSYFGALLGCTQYGQGAFPAYSGHASMYESHRFMDLDEYEVGYFIQQVGLAAASFGVAMEDITVVAGALSTLFNVKCAPPVTVIPAQGPVLESICIADSCPLAPNATCSSYAAAVVPSVSNSTMSGNSTSASTSGSTSASASASASRSASGSAPAATQTSNGAGYIAANVAMGAVGVVAAVFAL